MRISSPNVTDGGKFQTRRRMKDLPVGSSWSGRIVAGPIHRHFHMWPTRASDPTTNVIKNTWRSVMVNPSETNMLDKLASIDKALKQKALVASGGDPKKARSVLEKGDRFDYAVIFRNTGKPPVVEIMEANWTVFDAINQLKNKKDPQKPEYLLYGLPFMYDIIIEKRLKPTTGQPDYAVSIYPPTLRTGGLVHSGYLDQDKNPFPNPEQFFSADDLALIQACPFELEDIDKPVPPEKVMDIVREFPIDLNHRLKDNASVFTFFNRIEDLLAIQEYAKTSGTHFYVPNQQDLAGMGGQSAPPSGHQALPPANPGRAAVDAQYSVVPPEQPAPASPPSHPYPPVLPTTPPIYNAAGTEYQSPIPGFPNNPAPPTFGPGAQPTQGPAYPPAGSFVTPPAAPAAGAPPMAERVAPFREGPATAPPPPPTFSPAPPPAHTVAPGTLERPADLW